MSTPIKLDEVGGITVWQDYNLIKFTAGFAINSDGSPHSYHPQSNKGLDYLANAGRPGNWWGIAVDADGIPYIQGDDDPAPGYYVSTTALQNLEYKIYNPRRYIDSEKVPYIVLPGRHYKHWGIKLGAEAIVRNIRSGKEAKAIFADIGPANKLGEGSIALAEILGLNADPKRGGTASRIISYEVTVND